jgi:hypothetical protein
MSTANSELSARRCVLGSRIGLHQESEGRNMDCMKGLIVSLYGFLVLAVPATLRAQFDYTINADGVSVTITGYANTNAVVVIPTNINGLAVTSIGTNAFEDSDSLGSITIPSTVTTIGDYAFASCYGLTNATIFDGLTRIGNSASALPFPKVS